MAADDLPGDEFLYYSQPFSTNKSRIIIKLTDSLDLKGIASLSDKKLHAYIYKANKSYSDLIIFILTLNRIAIPLEKMALLLLQLILAGQYEFIRLATLRVHDRKRAHGLPSPFSIASAEKDGDHQRNGVYSYPRLKKWK